MRRQTLFSAFRRVTNDLRESGVYGLFEKMNEDMRPSSGREEFRLPFGPFQKYSILYSQYSDAEREILSIFGLDVLSAAEFWEGLSVGIDPGAVYGTYYKLNQLMSVVPKILNLISQEYIEEIKSKSPDIDDIFKGKEVITAIISEGEGEFSHPDRILYAIDSINKLYQVHAEILSLSPDDIILLACDSGSDKSFDFLGLAQVVQGLKETIISIWDRVVFHRHAQAMASIETIAASLPVLGQISELERTGAIGREVAETLRRKAIGACTKFVEAGVMIPEMEAEAKHSPRALLSPERRLLAAPDGRPHPLARTTSEVSQNPAVEDQDAKPGPADSQAVLDKIAELSSRLEKAEAAASQTKRRRTGRSSSAPRSQRKAKPSGDS